MEKPEALTSLQQILPEAFEVLKKNFGVQEVFILDLASIDSVSEQTLSRLNEVAAISMRKLQLLYIHARPGAQTPTDTVIGLCAELIRSVYQLTRGGRVENEDDHAMLIALLQALQACAVVVGGLPEMPGDIEVL